jgi:hypothetical protein
MPKNAATKRHRGKIVILRTASLRYRGAEQALPRDRYRATAVAWLDRPLGTLELDAAAVADFARGSTGDAGAGRHRPPALGAAPQPVGDRSDGDRQ